MLRRIKKGNNRTKLIIVPALLCVALSVSGNAQTNSDKPLNAQQLANLKTGLKQVVQENLTIAETDGKKYAAINQKWNARKDLAGKSKTQVINLLFEDVKAVVTDPGMQYQISSIFSMYKQMPDEQFSDQRKSKETNSSKQALIDKLVELVFTSHPYVYVEQELAKYSETKEFQSAKQEDRKKRVESFDAALKINSQLTAAQKSFVRANYDKLIEITDRITEDAMDKNFPTVVWIKESLGNSFNKQFAVEEINNLIAFFESKKGEQVLNYVRQTEMAQLITGNGGKPDFTAADQAEHAKFIATPLGKKFINAYLTEAEAYAKRRETAARSIPDGDGMAIYESANLNKIFNRFVRDNYKK